MGGRGGSGHAHAASAATSGGGGGEAAATSSAASDTKAAAVNARYDRFITSTVTNIGGKGEWVPLTDLRSAMADRGLSRAAQDEHLKRMSREGKLHVAPKSNRKLLTAADHAAALRVGGEENHWVLIPK